MVALTFIAAVVLLPVIIVTACFAAEVFAGITPLAPICREHWRGRVAVVVPAHNEKMIIGETVSSLVGEMQSQYGLLVVADNCTDETADVARRSGAQVLVRDDSKQRGKGFALAAARERLSADPPEVVIIVDADCRIDGQSLAALAGASADLKRPCQAVYLLRPDLQASAMVQISNLAFMVKNLLRQRGLLRIAGRVHLTGTGMALPWALFEVADLGGANIVEDLALGLDLAKRNAPPSLVEEAAIWSGAASADDTLVQRGRWEGGFLSIAIKAVPTALARSLGRGDLRGVFAALDLAVPPLALLAIMNVAALAVGAAAWLLGAETWPLGLLIAVGLAAAAALAIAWVKEGRRFASGSTLARLPLYVFWKLPLYLGLVRRGAPKEWLRTGR